MGSGWPLVWPGHGCGTPRLRVPEYAGCKRPGLDRVSACQVTASPTSAPPSPCFTRYSSKKIAHTRGPRYSWPALMFSQVFSASTVAVWSESEVLEHQHPTPTRSGRCCRTYEKGERATARNDFSRSLLLARVDGVGEALPFHRSGTSPPPHHASRRPMKSRMCAIALSASAPACWMKPCLAPGKWTRSRSPPAC